MSPRHAVQARWRENCEEAENVPLAVSSSAALSHSVRGAHRGFFKPAWWTISERRAALEREIDAVVVKAMEERTIAGLSVAVARDGRLIHLKGYGYADLENRIPASDKTIYHVGSITKQFTAAAVMQLVDKGVVALDRPISDYIPDYPTHRT